MNKKLKSTCIAFMVVVFGSASSVFAKNTLGGSYKGGDTLSTKAIKLVNTSKAENVIPIHEYNFDNESEKDSHVIDTGSKSTNMMDNANTSNTDVVNEDGRIFRKFNGSNSNILITDEDIPSKNVSMKFDVRFPSGSGLQTNNIISSRNGINLSLEYGSLNFSIGYVNANTGRTIDAANLSVDAQKYLDGKWHTIVLTYAGNYQINGVKMYIDDLSTPAAVGTEESGEASNDGQDGDITLGGGTFDLDNFQIYDKVLNQQNGQVSK